MSRRAEDSAATGHRSADLGARDRRLDDVIAELRAARRVFAARSSESILASLEEVVHAWLEPESPWMAQAIAQLPEATGFSPAMIRHALPTMLEPLCAPALADIVTAEATGRRAPALILHVLPGNLPGLAAIPATLSLAIGAAALLKSGLGDRRFAPLFVDSIVACAPDLGACLAAQYWAGGDAADEDIALAAADLVVAAGDDATIASLARRVRGRFIGHGHRISFAVVTAAIAGDVAAQRVAAARLAADVAMWDQRGCLSPQFCIVEGDLDDAVRFADAVTAALRPLATALPPARMSSAERLAVRRFGDAAEWRGLAGEAVSVLRVGVEGEGTVVVEPLAAVTPSPLQRSLTIMPMARCEDLDALLEPARHWLEGAGLAAPPEQWPAVAARLGACGVHLISPLGRMQRPPLAWRQGGRPRLAAWVE